MTPIELRPGLWRWTAPHPSWHADASWDREVASIAWEPDDPAEPLVLIDPLLPPDPAPLWGWLDRRAGRVVAVLLANCYHGRSAQAVHDRLGAAVWAMADARGKAVAPVGRAVEDGALPGGIQAIPIDGLDAGEVAYFIAARGALVLADALLGAGDGALRLAPRDWAADGPGYDRRFRAALSRLLELPVELVLPSHGPPVLA